MPHCPTQAGLLSPTIGEISERAGEGVRTLDIQLGKLMLCQLSYARLQAAGDVPNVRPLSSARGASDTQHVAKYIAPLDRRASMQYTVAREA